VSDLPPEISTFTLTQIDSQKNNAPSCVYPPHLAAASSCSRMLSPGHTGRCVRNVTAAWRMAAWVVGSPQVAATFTAAARLPAKPQRSEVSCAK
jgi:hypothetical protein